MVEPALFETLRKLLKNAWTTRLYPVVSCMVPWPVTTKLNSANKATV